MLRRRMLIMLGVVLLIVLVLAGYKAFSIYTMIQGFSAPKPPISVAVATATERPWQARLPTVGTLKALQGVDLSLETDGTVIDVQFESGQKVKAGQPILQLDSAVESALLETALGRPRAGPTRLRSRQPTGRQPGHFQRRVRPTLGGVEKEQGHGQSTQGGARQEKASSRRSAGPSAFARWTSATTWPAAP